MKKALGDLVALPGLKPDVHRVFQLRHLGFIVPVLALDRRYGNSWVVDVELDAVVIDHPVERGQQVVNGHCRGEQLEPMDRQELTQPGCGIDEEESGPPAFRELRGDKVGVVFKAIVECQCKATRCLGLFLAVQDALQPVRRHVFASSVERVKLPDKALYRQRVQPVERVTHARMDIVTVHRKDAQD